VARMGFFCCVWIGHDVYDVVVVRMKSKRHYFSHDNNNLFGLFHKRISLDGKVR